MGSNNCPGDGSCGGSCANCKAYRNRQDYIEEKRAAETIAMWAGVGEKREMIAAQFLSKWFGPQQFERSLHSLTAAEDYEIVAALKMADRLIKLSRENPPKE